MACSVYGKLAQLDLAQTFIIFASEMTYIVSGGALNSTHSLT